MKTVWRSMARTTLRGVCPSCGQGSIFRGVYELRSRCGECQLDLKGQDGAQFGGPMALGYGIGGLSGLAVFALLFGRFGFQTWVVWASVSVVVAAILLTFRHCKAWWTWWLFATGELRGGKR